MTAKVAFKAPPKALVSVPKIPFMKVIKGSARPGQYPRFFATDLGKLTSEPLLARFAHSRFLLRFLTESPVHHADDLLRRLDAWGGEEIETTPPFCFIEHCRDREQGRIQLVSISDPVGAQRVVLVQQRLSTLRSKPPRHEAR